MSGLGDRAGALDGGPSVTGEDINAKPVPGFAEKLT